MKALATQLYSIVMNQTRLRIISMYTVTTVAGAQRQRNQKGFPF